MQSPEETALSPRDRLLADLLAAAAQRGEVAFAELYRLTSGKLYALARRIVGTSRASDALQEAYVRIWTNAGRYDPARGRPQHWMAAVTRNYCLSMLRIDPLSATTFQGDEIPVLVALDFSLRSATLPGSPGRARTELRGACILVRLQPQ